MISRAAQSRIAELPQNSRSWSFTNASTAKASVTPSRSKALTALTKAATGGGSAAAFGARVPAAAFGERVPAEKIPTERVPTEKSAMATPHVWLSGGRG